MSLTTKLPPEKENEIEGANKRLAASFLFLVGMSILFPVDAAIFQLLWNWFVAPLGPPSLGYWHAFGLRLLLHFLVECSRTRPIAGGWEPPKAQRIIINAYVVRISGLTTGWIIHWLMTH